MDENDHTFETTHAPPQIPSEAESPINHTKRIEFDIEKYRPHLEDVDITEDQKQELLEALWMIMTSFVDLGFQIHPVQQACGQVEKAEPLPDLSGGDAVYSNLKSSIRTFTRAATSDECGQEGGGRP